MSLFIKAGKYTGNGSDPQTITGIGFTPLAVFVAGNASVPGIWRTDKHPANTSSLLRTGGQVTSGELASFASGQFNVSGNGNLDTKDYYYLALGGSSCITGSYVGNTTDNRDIEVGVTPVMVLVQGSAATYSYWRTNQHPDGNNTYSESGSLLTVLKSFGATNFRISNSTNINANSTTYYYVALPADSNLVVSNFAGDGADNRNITGVGFTPTCVWLQVLNGQNTIFRTTHSGDLTSEFFVTAPAANKIQAYGADGFQVGSDAKANENLHTVVYLAFKDYSSAVKSINGLARGSVSKINGLALSSVKSFNGLV